MQDVKCVAVGNGKFKTELLCTFKDNVFPHDYCPVFFDNYNTTIISNGQEINLGLWDTPTIDPSYDRTRILSLPQTNVFLLLFSVVSMDSLLDIKQTFLYEIKHHAPDVPYIMVATQSHLRNVKEYSDKIISKEFCVNMAKEIGAVKYMECSAEKQQGLKVLFDEAILTALDHISAKQKKKKTFSLFGSLRKNKKKSLKQKHDEKEEEEDEKKDNFMNNNNESNFIAKRSPYCHRPELPLRPKIECNDDDVQENDNEYDENIILQLIELGIGTREDIIDAIDNVVNQMDLNEICEYIMNKKELDIIHIVDNNDENKDNQNEIKMDDEEVNNVHHGNNENHDHENKNDNYDENINENEYDDENVDDNNENGYNEENKNENENYDNMDNDDDEVNEQDEHANIGQNENENVNEDEYNEENKNENENDEYDDEDNKMDENENENESEEKEIIDITKYLEWDSNHCVDWIMSLENGMFLKYKNEIYNAFTTELICGAHLEYIDANDLNRFGVQSFIHKKILIQHIESLIEINNDNDINEYDEDIISQLIELGIGNREQIIDAIDNVIDKKDINDISNYVMNKQQELLSNMVLQSNNNHNDYHDEGAEGQNDNETAYI